MRDTVIDRLVAAALPAERVAATRALRIPAGLGGDGGGISRAQVAMALNIVLFADLLARVSTAATYVGEVEAGGGDIVFDHGALRTVDGDTGALPGGHAAFARLLEPLGYAVAGVYPLPRLRMTGRAFAHRDFPADIPQFFVSELHVAELDGEARAAAGRVFGGSRDPLGPAELALLDRLSEVGSCEVGLAVAGLPGLARAFDRAHPEPSLADYQLLLAHSSEAAWIATEGNAFNHATDRVADVERLAEALKARGYAMKDRVEISANRRVRQTALLANPVTRRFTTSEGVVERPVPGSFYEFISRDADRATGRLDLTFDSGNATGIFAVTKAA